MAKEQPLPAMRTTQKQMPQVDSTKEERKPNSFGPKRYAAPFLMDATQKNDETDQK